VRTRRTSARPESPPEPKQKRDFGRVDESSGPSSRSEDRSRNPSNSTRVPGLRTPPHRWVLPTFPSGNLQSAERIVSCRASSLQLSLQVGDLACVEPPEEGRLHAERVCHLPDGAKGGSRRRGSESEVGCRPAPHQNDSWLARGHTLGVCAGCLDRRKTLVQICNEAFRCRVLLEEVRIARANRPKPASTRGLGAITQHELVRFARRRHSERGGR
jgi:hypothetical protein